MNSDMGSSEAPSNFEQIRAKIQRQIKEIENTSNNPFDKPVFVYMPVKHNSAVDWLSHLHQSVDPRHDQHIVLIPYYTKQSHLIGIILHVDSDGYVSQPGIIENGFTGEIDGNARNVHLAVNYPQELEFIRFKPDEAEYEGQLQSIINLLLLKRSKSQPIGETIETSDRPTCASMQNQEKALSSAEFLTTHSSNDFIDTRIDHTNQTSNFSLRDSQHDERVLKSSNNRLHPGESSTHPSLNSSDAFSTYMDTEEKRRLKARKLRLIGELEFRSEYDLNEEIAERQKNLQFAEQRGQTKKANSLREELQKLTELQTFLSQLSVSDPSVPARDVDGNELCRMPSVDTGTSLASVSEPQRLPIDIKGGENVVPIERKIPESERLPNTAGVVDKEVLMSIYQSFHELPFCSDQLVLKLILLISTKLVSSQVLAELRVDLPDDVDNEINSLLCELNGRVHIEDMFTRRIEDVLATCQVHRGAKNWDSLRSELKRLWKILSPIDVEDLKSLVGKVDEAALKVKGKDIILLIGGTGAGKSTTTHFLGGSKLGKVVVDGINHIAPIEIKNPQLNEVTSAPSAVSITRYIQPVTLRLEDIGGDHDKYGILCDCPGFEDTSGAEVDIANGIGIVRAVKGCRSVKPVVLISYKSIGDRCTGVKELAHILVGMVENISDHLGAFEYFFTKFPIEERKNIHAVLVDVKRHLGEDEKHDTSFLSILEDLIEKTEDEVKVIDPINDKPLKLMRFLMKSSAIKYPNEVFRFSLSERSRSSVHQHVKQNQVNILSARKRFDYPYIQYKLDQLKYLSDLLEQDDLKQIYESSVKSVCEHLTEQYNTTTTMLKNCLINQNTLNDEDLSHYKSAIKRAMDANELRSKHLGEQVIQSDSYQQYLIKVVFSLKDEVQEKDIDDDKVKLTLDKLKFLSESFTNVKSIYAELLEVFREKVKKIDESFKKSMKDHKFEETAADMTKMKLAAKIFNGHIDNLERTYENEKEHFVTYLSKSVTKFEKTFERTLDKSDIENLSNCVEILESAERTFTLHVHISREKIHKIYETLSTRIVDHFNAIVSKIEELVEKKTELPVLEKLMIQLDEIRSISGIESKTNKNYFSILEKLIGHVNECKRICDHALKSFLAGESIDFQILSDSLSILQGAKWIEKYRENVYSDIFSALERQIMISLDSNENIVKNTNFGIDNIDNLMKISAIIHRNNEINKLHKMFPDIREKVNASNERFIRINHDCVVILTENFSSEKLNIENHTIDVDKAEKGLEYLQICQNIPVLYETNCSAILDKLEEFIRNYSLNIKSEMEENFDKIKHSKNDCDQDLSKNVRILIERFIEYSEIETDYKKVFSFFSDKKLVQHWKNTMINYREELEQEMILCSRNNRVKDLQIKLLIAKLFCRVDSLIDNSKFNDLYRKYQNVFFTGTDELGRRAMETLKKHEYSELCAELIALKQADKAGEHSLNQISRAIEIGINSLKAEVHNSVIMIRRNVTKDDVSTIVENLNKLQNAETFISEYTKNSGIKNCIEEVRSALEQKMNAFINAVKTTLELNNFSLFDQNLESVDLLRNILKSYCTEKIVKQIDELKEYHQTFIQDKVVKKYSDMSIDKYMIDPPTYIFAQLAEVRNTSTIYDQASKKIKDAIITKFRDELEKGEKRKPPSIENEYMRRVELAMKYLPEEIKVMMEHESQLCKDNIKMMIEDFQKKMKTASDSDDIIEIMNLLKEYQSAPEMKPYFNKLKEQTINKMREMISRLEPANERVNIPDMLEAWKEVCEYHSELTKININTENLYLRPKKRFSDVFDDTITPIVKFVETVRSKMDDSDIRSIDQKLQSLLEFVRFFIRHEDLEFVKELLPNDYNQKMSDLNKKVIDIVTNVDLTHKKAIEDLDIELMRNALEISKKYSSFISIIRNSSVKHSSDKNLYGFIMKVNEFTNIKDMTETVDRKLTGIQEELLSLEIISCEREETSTTVDEFYKDLNKKFSFMTRAKELKIFELKFDLDKAEEKCLDAFQQKITQVHKTAEERLKKYLENEHTQQKDIIARFNLLYNNLKLFHEKATFMKNSSMPSITIFEERIDESIQSWTSTFNQKDVESKARVMIRIKSASIDIYHFKTKFNDKIDELLDMVKRSQVNSDSIAKLGVLFNRDPTGVGQRIIAEHKAYQGVSISLFNEKTRKHGIKYVLDNLKGNNYDPSKLNNRYKEFDHIYKDIIKIHLEPKLDLQPLISDTKLLSKNIKYDDNKIIWDASIRNSVPKLATHIFALWTLQNAHHYFENNDSDKKESYLLQPHAAQVVSIFRMLGIGDSNERLENNLVQIGTGEGKSVTLAVTACILALLGFEVCCACYSEYLSDRDYRAFQSLFDALNVTQSIHYGTFNKLCEYVINQDGDIRQVVQEIITQNTNQTRQKPKQDIRPKILLIDEVDVFFNSDFYGNLYTPAVSLKDETISVLIKHIWSNRAAKLTLNQVKASTEYKKCCDRFPKWTALIDESIKDILADVKNFESHIYVVKDDKIGYVEQDKIAFNVSFGYKTLFAYFFEHEKKNISLTSLEEKLSILIKCGGYSYAEIPLQFTYIMGVTGTLETLSEPEKNIIENVYSIKKQTVVPSVFGKNNLSFTMKDDIKIENVDDYFNRIRTEIGDRLCKNAVKRAVLVFFESEKKLQDFVQAEMFKGNNCSFNVLTEETSTEKKESLIKQATGSGEITLLTKTFGRGTDFICYDPSVESNGGVHVIQTFLSEEVSEEVQIKGRTARQGEQGSYSMILLDKDLEKFGINPNNIEDLKAGKIVAKRFWRKITDKVGITDKYESIYEMLNDARIDFFKTKYTANKTFVEAAKTRHDKSVKFLESLKTGNIGAMSKFLIEENKGVEDGRRARTICLMDATGSMSHLLQKSKNTVGVMFERASTVLKENGISSDSFEIQFTVYRNYCCEESKILQHSPWETKPDNLRAFMNTINVEGGWGNEAIEIGLWHANQENAREGISQIILIGDAPPNSQQEVQAKRSERGENYWKNTKFTESTYYENELVKIKSDGIKVHSFYVDTRAQESFENIAQETGGRCEFLDINSDSGSEMLTNLVTEEILRNVGGSSKGNALVEAYKEKFAKTYQ